VATRKKAAQTPGTRPESPWRSRIVGAGEVPPEQLHPNPRNPRFHTRKQEAALVDVLTEVGIVQDVIVNTKTGYLVDGHLRVQAAISAGVPLLPVKYVELEEAEELLVLATFDPLAALAVWDKERANEVIEEARDAVTPGSALDLWLQEMALRHPAPGDELPTPDEMMDRDDTFLTEPVSDPPLDEDEDGAAGPPDRQTVVLYMTGEQRDALQVQAQAIAEALDLDTLADAVIYAVQAAYDATRPVPAT